jgi:hypothetical protein
LLILLSLLIFFVSSISIQYATGGGTVTVVASQGARIDSYYPSSKITVTRGQSFNLEVWFTNTGGSGAYFYAGFTIWDSNGNQYLNRWSDRIYLDAGRQGHASWTISIDNAGEYWLQFGIWNEARTTLLVRAPSPSQNLISVVEPTISQPQLIKTFSVTVTAGQSVEDTIIIRNPNNVAITVRTFTITDYQGFRGTVTALTSLPFQIPANSNGEIRVRITANSDCPPGPYLIRYRITGDPNNWEVLGD